MFVKGCQMPALQHETVRMPQNFEGRRRTSPEGGNRGMIEGVSENATIYGDLTGSPTD